MHNLTGKFCKVRFTSGREHTAGLVFDALWATRASIGELSRKFPSFEAGKMAKLEISPMYATWAEAFAHDFNEVKMTPAKLKGYVQSRGTESHFFDRKTMQFFGDTMRNYGVRSAVITTDYDAVGNYAPGIIREVWELYRKQPVKHGLSDSAYFCKVTFSRVRKGAV